MGGLPFEEEDGEEGACGEFPEAGAGVEVGVGLVGGGFDDGKGEGGYEDGAEDEEGGAGDFGAEVPDDEGDDAEEEGPEDEDLALHGEGPEVLVGGFYGGVLGVVVDGVVGEVPVEVVEDGGFGVCEEGAPAGGCYEEVGGDGGGEDDGEGCGEESLEDVEPVFEDVEGFAVVDFAEAGEGEEEGGDEEEDVDATGDASEPDVVGDDEEDGEGSESLDFGAECGLGGEAFP